jgi:hypothetical protein
MKAVYSILMIFCATCLLITGCKAPEKLSKKYYLSHSNELNQINSAYNKLYKTCPFILNFTDTRFRHNSIEISTDSVRYIYNTSIMNFSIADSIKKFGLSYKAIKSLGESMVRTRCISVARHSFYEGGQEFSANFLFFKQAKAGMFKESRYHVIIFFNEVLNPSIIKTFTEKQDLQQLGDNVFYTVSNRFK